MRAFLLRLMRPVALPDASFVHLGPNLIPKIVLEQL